MHKITFYHTFSLDFLDIREGPSAVAISYRIQWRIQKFQKGGQRSEEGVQALKHIQKMGHLGSKI
jgi:hypothetical protein